MEIFHTIRLGNCLEYSYNSSKIAEKELKFVGKEPAIFVKYELPYWHFSKVLFGFQ